MGILAALLSAGLFVTLATFTRIPVSTSQAIVGAVAGTGVALVGLDGRFFRLDLLTRIAVAWVATGVCYLGIKHKEFLILTDRFFELS